MTHFYAQALAIVVVVVVAAIVALTHLRRRHRDLCESLVIGLVGALLILLVYVVHHAWVGIRTWQPGDGNPVTITDVTG
jgi:succinate dehydrogenase hydrophobic anchor subunit